MWINAEEKMNNPRKLEVIYVVAQTLHTTSTNYGILSKAAAFPKNGFSGYKYFFKLTAIVPLFCGVKLSKPRKRV